MRPYQESRHRLDVDHELQFADTQTRSKANAEAGICVAMRGSVVEASAEGSGADVRDGFKEQVFLETEDRG